MSMTGGYVFFALGFLLLQSASTTLALSSPNGRAFPSRSLLETQNCTNLCESGETHESDSRGRVSSSCTCTQVITLTTTLPDMTSDFDEQISQENFEIEVEKSFSGGFDAIAVVNSSAFVEGTGLTVEILLFLPITGTLKYTDADLETFQSENLAVSPWTLDSPFGNLTISNYNLPDGGGTGIVIPTGGSPSPTPDFYKNGDASDRGMDDEGDTSKADIIYVIIGVIGAIFFFCGTTLGFIKYQKVKKAKLAIGQTTLM